MTDENVNPNESNAASPDTSDVESVMADASKLAGDLQKEVGIEESEQKPQFQLDPGDTRRPEVDVETQIDQISDMVDEVAESQQQSQAPPPAPTEAPTSEPPPIDDVNPIESAENFDAEPLDGDALTVAVRQRISVRDVIEECVSLLRSGLRMTLEGVLHGLEVCDQVFSFVGYNVRRMLGWAACMLATAAGTIMFISFS